MKTIRDVINKISGPNRHDAEIFKKRGLNTARKLASALRKGEITGDGNIFAAFMLLGELKSNAAVPVLRQMLLNESLDERSRRSAAEALGDIASELSLRILIRVLINDPDVEIRTVAAYALGRPGYSRHALSALAPLIDCIRNVNEAAQTRAQSLESLAILCELRPRRIAKAAPVVLAALDCAEVELRFWASYAAAILKLADAIPKLEKLLGDDRRFEAYETDSKLGAVAEEAQWAIGVINGVDKKSNPAFA